MDKITILKEYGITFTEAEEENAKKTLNNKHWYKCVKVADFLKRNNFEKISWYKTEFAYRVDIKIRRIIDEFLKGYEETIESRIMSLSEKLNWSLYNKTFNIKYRDWKDQHNNIRSKKNKSKVFFEEAVKTISKKNKLEDVDEDVDQKNNFKIIDGLNFGQKIALFSVVNKKAAHYIIVKKSKNIEALFENDTSEVDIDLNWKKYEDELNKMRILRNIISHVNILFISEKHKEKKKSFTVKELIASIDFLMGNETNNKLKEKINTYMQNTILYKNEKAYNVSNDFIKKLIKVNTKEMFND